MEGGGLSLGRGKQGQLTGKEPTVAVAGSKNLKYMAITADIKPVAKSSSRGPISRNVQSKHVPTPI